MHVILYQPEIPPNTGNIIRLCANSGVSLCLVKPLGFAWDDKRLRRAGLDYHDLASVALFDSLRDCLAAIDADRVYAFTTKASRNYADATFSDRSALLFGPETRGLPIDVLESFAPELKLRIPMRSDSRSINLSNAVAIAAFEALRQQGFPNAR
ncbi:MAG TPA: tRNA (uridine(34)/cytosine(34)/5-carboxymethylaminomethyluridine(34)-2'-O)-methyltransferase TrmL [Gammaproteobacteria bacterium]|nr:tRNA (uridine(34)/cytosine(34)/5-carboxymethylaminomethyluridine(34)-2'-O)-methyltransferase TrmL [Gammaproteobacteria bacterium]